MVLTVADVQGTSAADKSAKPRADREKPGDSKVRWVSAESPSAVPKRDMSLHIHGGMNLTHLIATARKFVFRTGVPLKLQEFVEEEASVDASPQVKDASSGAKETSPADNDAVHTAVKGTRAPDFTDENVRVWALVTGCQSRKRSHDEYVQDKTQLATLQLAGIDQFEAKRRNRIRKDIVEQMFGSNWNKKDLKERLLGDVAQPADVYVRKPGGGLEKYQGPWPDEDPSVSKTVVMVRDPWPGASYGDIPSTTLSQHTISYIFKDHEQRGKFMPEKAIALGVKPGPNFHRLTLGQTVTATDGTKVLPEQVMGPTRPGGGLAVVDIAEPAFITELISRPEWDDEELMSGVETMIWMLGPDIVFDPRIQLFMRKHDKLQHIVSSVDTCPNMLALESAAATAAKLNRLNPKIFPIPAYNNVMPAMEANAPYMAAATGLTVQLEPQHEIQTAEKVGPIYLKRVVDSTDAEVLKLAAEADKLTADPDYQAKQKALSDALPSPDSEVICLGTGSSLPSKYRNVSATMVRVPEYGNYLFDCGENTLGQLKRVLGDKLQAELQALKAIWISHLHADHHLGTISVIRAWHEATRDDPVLRDSQLLIASDMAFFKFLQETSHLDPYGYERLKIVSLHPGFSRVASVPLNNTAANSAFGLDAIHACSVNHCHGAMAVVFSFPNGFKIAYSGDCRPSTLFAELARDATLLIHEATFDNEMQGDAHAKRHCTTAEALEVARDMRAKRILLTHFSQRYQQIPRMADSGDNACVIVAFDYMRVRLRDFADVQHARPWLSKMFEVVEASEPQ